MTLGRNYADTSRKMIRTLIGISQSALPMTTLEVAVREDMSLTEAQEVLTLLVEEGLLRITRQLPLAWWRMWQPLPSPTLRGCSYGCTLEGVDVVERELARRSGRGEIA